MSRRTRQACDSFMIITNRCRFVSDSCLKRRHPARTTKYITRSLRRHLQQRPRWLHQLPRRRTNRPLALLTALHDMSQVENKTKQGLRHGLTQWHYQCIGQPPGTTHPVYQAVKQALPRYQEQTRACQALTGRRTVCCPCQIPNRMKQPLVIRDQSHRCHRMAIRPMTMSVFHPCIERCPRLGCLPCKNLHPRDRSTPASQHSTTTWPSRDQATKDTAPDRRPVVLCAPARPLLVPPPQRHSTSPSTWPASLPVPLVCLYPQSVRSRWPVVALVPPSDRGKSATVFKKHRQSRSSL